MTETMHSFERWYLGRQLWPEWLRRRLIVDFADEPPWPRLEAYQEALGRIRLYEERIERQRHEEADLGDRHVDARFPRVVARWEAKHR